MILKENNWEL